MSQPIHPELTRVMGQLSDAESTLFSLSPEMQLDKLPALQEAAELIGVVNAALMFMAGLEPHPNDLPITRLHGAIEGARRVK